MTEHPQQTSTQRETSDGLPPTARQPLIDDAVTVCMTAELKARVLRRAFERDESASAYVRALIERDLAGQSN